MYDPKPVSITAVGSASDPLVLLGQKQQAAYLRCYLSDLGATSILEEPYYFDRDYLSEFSAFYSTSARGYGNVCRRLHFFSGPLLTRQRLGRCVGDAAEFAKLRNDYLGFSVVRPLPACPFGRTVLRWYPERDGLPERVIAPSRTYTAYLCGNPLPVDGLAWQQQDTAVGACATVALWSMLHASAFDEFHAIPTTATITRAAHRTASLGSRVFPSTGLTINQVLEAIKEQDLSPMVLPSDSEALDPMDPKSNKRIAGFTRERFSSTCATFLRSGYTLLMAGRLLGSGLHSVCAVGFRPRPSTTKVVPGRFALEDATVEHLYVHDDNLGPGVRFKITTLGGASDGIVVLKPDAPPRPPGKPLPVPDPCATYPDFVPQSMVVAVQSDLRIASDDLHKVGMRVASKLSALLQNAFGTKVEGVTLGFRFVKLRDYLGRTLSQLLQGDPVRRGEVRLQLLEDVRPMSLYLGVIRIGLRSTPLLEILYDTTDSARNMDAFAHLVLHPGVDPFLSDLRKDHALGAAIIGHSAAGAH